MIVETKKISKEEWLKKSPALGIDWGEKRIGIAKSDDTKTISSPFMQITPKEALQKLPSIIKEWQIDFIILGLPLNMKNEETESSEKVHSFAKKLNNVLGDKIKIILFDERLTSSAVETMLVGQFDMTRKRRKEITDKLSSSVLLQNFLDLMKNS